MPVEPSRSRCSTTFRRWLIPCACSALALLPAALRAQRNEPVVEALAGLLAAEDARRFDPALLRSAARHPSPIVRRHAAAAFGRIGDLAALAQLLALLADPDTGVQANAAFSLGLLGDSAALPRLRLLALGETAETGPGVQVEAVTAIARIGGPAAARLLADVLTRWGASAFAASAPPVVVAALGEAWRLRADAPVDALLPFAGAPNPEARWRAVYSVGRLRTPAGAGALLAATEDSVALIRATAVRELTAPYADTANMARGALAARVRRLAQDPDPYVRLSALRALGTYGTAELTPVVVQRVSDVDPNVRLQALATLGQLPGPEAAEELAEHADHGPGATRRQALLSLARTAPAAALERIPAWGADADWHNRAAAADALALIGGDGAAGRLRQLLRDRDGRVVAAALGALSAVDSAGAVADARALTAHADPIVRMRAATQLGAASDVADLSRLVDLYGRASRDHIPDARLAALAALGRLAAVLSPAAVADAVLARFPTCDDYLLRRAAASYLPPLAARWGPAEPIATGRGAGDYRDIARRLVLPAAQGGPLPGLTIETEQGTVSLTLLAAEAPLTVNAFLTLAARGYFDGGTWHRVVPGFVAQDGDPRGDGFGGPGFALRDEVSRRRYGAGSVGLALDGPDTGGSQFFITLTPQPHLDGIYPVFGVVDGGEAVLADITQGDRIRRVRRR